MPKRSRMMSRSSRKSSSEIAKFGTKRLLRTVPDARVRNRVEQINGRIYDHEHRGKQQHAAVDQGHVAIRDRVERQAADSGPGEDTLRQHGPTEQQARLQPQHRDNWDERVTQCML